VAYGTTGELQRLLRLQAPTVAQTEAMQRCLDAAAEEIDWELGYTTLAPAPVPPPPLVVEVNYERAVEHWQQGQVPFGIWENSLGPVMTGQNTWKRHAAKLLPLKIGNWGVG
jgi:hypothetical protein